MNQQTLQKIYKTYQAKQYYNRFFNQLKLRQDSRQFSQARDTKITIRNNTVAVSKGQTIVICQLATSVEKVIFNSVQKSYGKALLTIDVKMSSAKGLSMRQNRPTSSVSEFVDSKINWSQIEDQLVFKETGNRYFAHTGQIQVRVVSNDGSVNQVCLLAVQLLLWCSQFNKIDPQSGELKNQFYLLEIPYFYYPSKYCQILNQLLIDPTLSEEQNSLFTLTIIGDLLNQKITQSYTLIQKLGKNCQKIPKVILDSIISMWKVQMSKLPLDITELRRRVNVKNSANQIPSIELIISQ